jgi:hypothetical protein
MQSFFNSVVDLITGNEKKQQPLRKDKPQNYEYLPSYMKEGKQKIKNYLIREQKEEKIEEEPKQKKYRPNLFKPMIKLPSSIRTKDDDEEYTIYPMTRQIVYPGQPHPDQVIFYFDTEGNTFNSQGLILILMNF